MPARRSTRPDLERQLADLARRVDEMEAFLQHAGEVIRQGLLGEIALEATVLAPLPPHLQPEVLAEIIRTVLREELGQVSRH